MKAYLIYLLIVIFIYNVAADCPSSVNLSKFSDENLASEISFYTIVSSNIISPCVSADNWMAQKICVENIIATYPCLYGYLRELHIEQLKRRHTS